MIDLSFNMLLQCFDLIIPLILLCLVFEFIGSYFFNKK